jgi:plasmid stability protein
MCLVIRRDVKVDHCFLELEGDIDARYYCEKHPRGTHRALKLCAAQNGRSTEAEVRAILDSAVRPSVGIGSALVAIGRKTGGVELKIRRDRRPVNTG